MMSSNTLLGFQHRLCLGCRAVQLYVGTEHGRSSPDQQNWECSHRSSGSHTIRKGGIKCNSQLPENAETTAAAGHTTGCSSCRDPGSETAVHTQKMRQLHYLSQSTLCCVA